MALYDNKYWLLSHIRNSFISSDDTGMCEIVMSGEDVSQIKSDFADGKISDDSDDCLSIESGDLSFSIDFGMRARTNTAARIEKIEQAKKRAAKVKLIKWDSRKVASNENADLEEMFQKVDPQQKGQPVKKSLLSEKLKECTNLPKNPYVSYAKYDAHGLVNTPSKQYKIFFTIPEEQSQLTFIDVTCVATSKVMDLIGLILYHIRNKYVNMFLHPPTHYGLYITEDDGEVDRDLPPLDFRECISKFGFTSLGLVEHKEPVVSFDESVKQTQEIDKPFQKKILKDYLKIDETKKIRTDLEVMAVHKKAMEAPLYQSFQVYIITKMRSKVEVHLGISGDKVEIDPIQPQTSKFSLSKQKPVSCHIDSIAWCEVTDSKSGKSSFRMFYSNNYGGFKKNVPEKSVSSFSPLQTSASFKHFDFEADDSVAKEIVQKINLILDVRSSQSRKEYLASKERKQYKRKSFNIAK